MTEPTIDPAVPPRLQDDKTLPGVIYALLIASVLTGGLTSVIAVIIAYVSRKDAPEWLASHYEFQIRTFWLSLLFGLAGIILTTVGVGVVVLAATGVWLVVRSVVGLSKLLKSEPYPTPRNWML